jgi:hypothetical protein
MSFYFAAALCLWANSPEGGLVIGTLSPQIYCQRRATKELTRRLEQDGTLAELRKMAKEWQQVWKE